MASQEYETFCREAIPNAISSDLAIEEIRTRFDAFMTSFPCSEEVRFEPFTIGEIPAVWGFAPEVTRRRILLFFHGDTFAEGSIASHKNFIGRLSAAAHAAVCAIQYRLIPEHSYPAALEDALTAYRWLIHHPYPRSRILFAGMSSGAGLALSLFLRLREEQIAMPAAGLLLCPWINLHVKKDAAPTQKNQIFLQPGRLAWSAEKYAAGRSLLDPLISPIHGNLQGLPPLFIQTGTQDILYQDALELAERMQRQGAEAVLDVWPDMVHSWQMFAPRFPESQEAIERAGAFVERIFAG